MKSSEINIDQLFYFMNEIIFALKTGYEQSTFAIFFTNRLSLFTYIIFTFFYFISSAALYNNSLIWFCFVHVLKKFHFFELTFITGNKWIIFRTKTYEVGHIYSLKVLCFVHLYQHISLFTMWGLKVKKPHEA